MSTNILYSICKYSVRARMPEGNCKTMLRDRPARRTLLAAVSQGVLQQANMPDEGQVNPVGSWYNFHRMLELLIIPNRRSALWERMTSRYENSLPLSLSSAWARGFWPDDMPKTW